MTNRNKKDERIAAREASLSAPVCSGWVLGNAWRAVATIGSCAASAWVAQYDAVSALLMAGWTTWLIWRNPDRDE